MELTLLDLFDLGGWAMWPLVVFSIATLALFAERAVVLITTDLATAPLRDALLPLLERGAWAEAQSHCTAAPERTIVARVYGDALAVRDMGEARVERAFEAGATRQITHLERGLDLLVALGSIAPITGFLGTVSGMIAAFNSIATAADVNAQLVAGGIFEALITTAFGLAIALIAITGYNIFAHIVDRFAADMEQAGNDIITAMAHGTRAEHGTHAEHAARAELSAHAGSPESARDSGDRPL
jgi:biopolymer transport protein ExbB